MSDEPAEIPAALADAYREWCESFEIHCTREVLLEYRQHLIEKTSALPKLPLTFKGLQVIAALPAMSDEQAKIVKKGTAAVLDTDER